MRWTMMVVVAMAACDCEAPETYRGGAQTGWFSAGSVECATYRTAQCDYTLCQSVQGACGWDLTDWWCW